MAEESPRIFPRTVYSHRFVGQAIGKKEAVRILELQRRVRNGDSSGSSQISDTELEAFAKRIRASDGILAYLSPEGMDMREFVKAGAAHTGQLTGVAFFGTTTGLLHDLAFDYETIDSLTAEPDPHTDRYLLETLLEERKNRYVIALAQKSDERLFATLNSLGFEVQAEKGDSLIIGLPAEGESFPTINNAPKHCDPPPPITDEYIISEFRELLSEATGFTVDMKMAELIFSREYALIGDAKEFGSSDTVTREASYSVFSNFLLGKDWPMNRDITEEGQFERFLSDLRSAYELKLRELES